MTHPELDHWPAVSGRYRRSEITQLLGVGEDLWERASRDVLLWAVKTRSGFRVEGPARAVQAGERVAVTARVLGVRIVEPVQVMSVIDDESRAGFAYRTLPGHPVDGEEAFIVHREGNGGTDDRIWLTIRSLTRAAPRGRWRLAYPLLLLAQGVARRRYRRALH